MNVTHAGQGATGAVDLNDRTLHLKLISSGGAATVTLNNKTISLPASMISYEDIPGNYDVFTVVSGTVDYIAFG